MPRQAARSLEPGQFCRRPDVSSRHNHRSAASPGGRADLGLQQVRTRSIARAGRDRGKCRCGGAAVTLAGVRPGKRPPSGARSGCGFGAFDLGSGPQPRRATGPWPAILRTYERTPEAPSREDCRPPAREDGLPRSTRAELKDLRGDSDKRHEIFLSAKAGCFGCHRAVGRGESSVVWGPLEDRPVPHAGRTVAIAGLSRSDDRAGVSILPGRHEGRPHDNRLIVPMLTTRSPCEQPNWPR